MMYGEAYLEGWRNIFNYEGVSNRFEFWSFMIGSDVICLLPLLCWRLVVTTSNDYGVFIFFALSVSFILTLILAVSAIALAVRRMHDIGHSGWWVTVAVLIPVMGVILLILCCPPPRSQNQA